MEILNTNLTVNNKMYYQVLIETTEQIRGKNKRYFELDITNLTEIEKEFVIPYLQKEKFQFDGYFINPSIICRFVIKQTEKTTKTYAKYENDNRPRNVIGYTSRQDIVLYDKYTTDITKSVFQNAKEKIGQKTNQQQSLTNNQDRTKVFIVHGHDDLAKSETARFIEKLGFEAIILHEQVSSGKTIIEKIEEYSNVGFGVVLYTPCDKGAQKNNDDLQPRARQNVIFEHGYLIGKLGRQNVCALVKGTVEKPNDISGVVYIPMDDHKAWYIMVAKELRNAGYNVDLNSI